MQKIKINEVKINFALLKKSKAYELKEKAELDLINSINFKTDRADRQRSERSLKRKRKNI